MTTKSEDNESDVPYKLGVDQSPRRSEDEDLDSDLDVCLLDDASSDIRKNMSDVPDEDLSDDLLHSDEEELTICLSDTVDSSQATSPVKPPSETQDKIAAEILKESPPSPVEGAAVDLKETEDPQGKVISSQDEESDHSSATADATSAEEPGEGARDQESEDEPVDIEINEPFNDEFQVIEIKENPDIEAPITTESKESLKAEEEEEEDDDEEEEDEEPCHSRFKSERKEGMVVVRLSDGASKRRNIPDTLELSGDCRAGSRAPGGRGGTGYRKPSSSYLMLSRMEVRGFDPRPQPHDQRPRVQPPMQSHPLLSPPHPRPPQQRYFSQPVSFSQPSHQVPLMSAQSQAKPAVAPQCLSGVAAVGPSHLPQPRRPQHAEPWRGQAPPKEKNSTELLVPGQHMLDQWRCPRPLDCSPRFPGQPPRRTPPPLRPRLGQASELGREVGLGTGTGTGMGTGRQAGLGQPLAGRMEPLRSNHPLPPPPPHKMLVALNSGQLHSRPFLSQHQLGQPRACSPTSDQPPTTPCAPVRPARSSKVSPCFTKPSAFADAAESHTQGPVQTQSPSQIGVPCPPAARRTLHVRTDTSRSTPAPAAQVRPITRAEPCAKPVAVASGVTATAATLSMPAQRAKAEAAASAAPEPVAPVRNAGQKVKEEPPSAVGRAQSPLAKACAAETVEKEDEETRAYRELMEEQKKKRMEVLRQKEQRRILLAKEKRRALQESNRTPLMDQGHGQEVQQRRPRERGPPWGQDWAAQPHQQAHREFAPPPPPLPPPPQYAAEDPYFQQGPCSMGPAGFREAQKDEVFSEGPSSSQLNRRGPRPLLTWTDHLQGPGVRPVQQQNQLRQPWGVQIQRHVRHQNHPDPELRLGHLSSDTSPQHIQCQSQVIPAPPDPPECRSDLTELPSDRLQSEPWTSPPLEPGEQRWFRPPKIWTPPLAGKFLRQRSWVSGEEEESVGSIRPLLKRTVAQREEDHEDEDERPPVKVIRQITTGEEHSAQCFHTVNVAMNQDPPNVTRRITMGRSPQHQPPQLQNMQDIDEGGGMVYQMSEPTGLWRRCTNSVPNSNLIVKINY